MKKATVNFTYDEEKYEALRRYMTVKNLPLDDIFADYAEHLYKKHVPSVVREYIEKRPPGTIKKE